MNPVLQTGRILFGVGFLGLGVQHFILQEFITGRPPAWPDAFPGQTLWAYASGAAVAGMGLACLTRERVRLAAMVAGTLILGWGLLRHIPVLAHDSFLAPSWTRAGKALVFFGGVFAVAASFPGEEFRRKSRLAGLINLRDPYIALGRISLGIFLLITGIQHFRYTEFVASLIPGWFPGNAVFWTWFAGVALIAGGTGLLVPRSARLAALLSGLMVFSWFWIVHLPRTFVSVSDRIALFEALAVAGIGLVLAATPTRENVAPTPRDSGAPVQQRPPHPG